MVAVDHAAILTQALEVIQQRNPKKILVLVDRTVL